MFNTRVREVLTRYRITRVASVFALILVPALLLGCAAAPPPASQPAAPPVAAQPTTAPAAAKPATAPTTAPAAAAQPTTAPAAAAKPATAPTTAPAAAKPASPSGGKILRMNTTQAVGNHFNPIWFIGTGSQWHTFPFLWLPPVFYTPEGQMEPWLAESIDVSPDAKVYTFKLHKDAKWTDGKPVTAEDVKFSYELLLNPETKEIGAPITYQISSVTGATAFGKGEAKSIEGIQVVDEKTVRFNLAESNPLFLQDAWVFVMPKHVLGGKAIKDLANDPYMDNPTVTSGPFKLAKYEPRQYIELEPWKEYWGTQKSSLERVVLVQASNTAVMNMIGAGELDLGVYLTIDNLDQLSQLPKVKPIVQLTQGESNIYVNGRKEYLKDPRVRQGLAYAIDRNSLNQLLYKGQGVPIYSEVIGPDWAVSPNMVKYDYNPDKARQLLQEAKWDFNRTLVYWTSITDRPDDLAVFLQESFKSVGVKMEIQASPFSAVADAYNSNTFDLSLLGGGNQALDPHFAMQTYTCGSLWSSWLNYCNSELEELRKAGISTSDQKKRQETYWKAGEILNRDLPFIYLFRPPTVYAVSDRLKNFEAPVWFRFANANMLAWDVAQ